MMTTKIITVTEKESHGTVSHSDVVFTADPWTLTIMGLFVVALLIKWLAK